MESDFLGPTRPIGPRIAMVVPDMVFPQTLTIKQIGEIRFGRSVVLRREQKERLLYPGEHGSAT
jgi:hypothetical protein